MTLVRQVPNMDLPSQVQVEGKASTAIELANDNMDVDSTSHPNSRSRLVPAGDAFGLTSSQIALGNMLPPQAVIFGAVDAGGEAGSVLTLDHSLEPEQVDRLALWQMRDQHER